MGGPMTQQEIIEEQQSFLRITEAFRRYKRNSQSILRKRKGDFDTLHPKYKELFGQSEPLFKTWLTCIETNAQFLGAIVDASQHLFGCYWPDGPLQPLHETPTGLDMDKVVSTVKQFVRDWGEEGKVERQLTYDPIYATMERNWPDIDDRHAIKVLVPGSGLSRLAFELSLKGFSTQGNEFSHHMLISGHFLLNHATHKNQFVLHPYVDSSVNVYHRADQFRAVAIPDMCPADAIDELVLQGRQQGDFSMVAGDFLEVYNKPEDAGQWEAVITCYFIDTAHNVFEYIETIHRLLPMGGLWINVGPLLYHFSDSPDELSIDLSYDEIRRILVTYGFNIEEERRVQSGYTADACSMKWTVYNCVYFVARKVGDPQTPQGSAFAVQNPHAMYAAQKKKQQQEEMHHQQLFEKHQQHQQQHLQHQHQQQQHQQQQQQPELQQQQQQQPELQQQQQQQQQPELQQQQQQQPEQLQQQPQEPKPSSGPSEEEAP